MSYLTQTSGCGVPLWHLSYNTHNSKIVGQYSHLIFISSCTSILPCAQAGKQFHKFRRIIKIQGLRLGTSEIDRLRGADLKNLLRERKLVLILDLDHTLINSTKLQDLSSAEKDLGIQTAASKGNIIKLYFKFSRTCSHLLLIYYHEHKVPPLIATIQMLLCCCDIFGQLQSLCYVFGSIRGPRKMT